jgi:isopenicillin-N N-acyltransferase-like protein
MIQSYVAQRLQAASRYLAERGGPQVAELLTAGAACMRVAQAWHEEGIEEHLAIAEAAGVDAAALYATTNMTDVRDVLLLPSPADTEGCSVLVVPPALSAGAALLAAQTWDLNPEDLPFVVAVHRLPEAGPETWSVTCSGALSLIGMNQHGLAVGTTNIKTRGSRPGAGYLSVLHRALSSVSRPEARTAVKGAPRAAGHTYWLADVEGAVELECSAERCEERELGQEPIARTNHCLSGPLRDLEGEQPTSSSYSRLERLKELAARGAHTVESLKALLADRSDGVDSVNRYAEDAQGTSTNACLIAVPAERELWACRGPADRGLWVKLPFSRG